MIASSGARPSVSGTNVKWYSVVVANCQRDSVRAFASRRLNSTSRFSVRPEAALLLPTRPSASLFANARAWSPKSGLRLVGGILTPSASLAHLALAEVTQEREQRPDLAALVLEMDRVDESAALLGRQLLGFLQIDAPVAPADHVGGERLAVEDLLRRLGDQVGAQRHVRGEEPRGRADADEVVVAAGSRPPGIAI